jgi:hypothetical protein
VQCNVDDDIDYSLIAALKNLPAQATAAGFFVSECSMRIRQTSHHSLSGSSMSVLPERLG